MKILQVKVGKFPVLIEVEHSLDMMHKLVGGYIELVRVTDDIDMWINEEGKLVELPPNFALIHGGQTFDIIAGDCFFASHDEEGETISLTPNHVLEIMSRFYTRTAFIMD